MSDWQDIATAPRDGTVILVYDAEHKRPTIARVHQPWDGWFSVPGRYPLIRVTHWQRLPAPPRDADTRETTNDDHAVLPDCVDDPTTL